MLFAYFIHFYQLYHMIYVLNLIIDSRCLKITVKMIIHKTSELNDENLVKLFSRNKPNIVEIMYCEMWSSKTWFCS